MNTKRIFFWIGFIVILGLIVWGLIVAINKPATLRNKLVSPDAVTATDHVRGPTNAPVTIIEYSDFQCPACGSYYPWVERLVNEASSTVRMVYRHYPLPQHLNAPLAAQASEAASKQGKFWEMYGLLFQNQNVWSSLADAKARVLFEEYANRLGLDLVAYRTDLESVEVKQKIRGDLQGGVSIGIDSTPTFFINGAAIVNPQSYDAFKKIIDDAARSAK